MRGKKYDANNNEYGTYHCFVCQARYDEPRNKHHNALQEHVRRNHDKDEGFICTESKCKYKKKQYQHGCQIVLGRPKIIWAQEMIHMHQITYEEPDQVEKGPAIPDEKKT